MAPRHAALLFLLLVQGVTLARSGEHSVVNIDLDDGLVSGYSARVRFFVTPSSAAGAAGGATAVAAGEAGVHCGRRAVIAVELGGAVRVARLLLRFANPRLWTFHLSDSLDAEGFGYHSSVNASSTVELQLQNQQLRVCSAWPSGASAPLNDELDEPGSAHSQWMYLRVVDETVRKSAEVELTFSLKGNSFRWQDERLAHDFSAPPGLFYENGEMKERVTLFISMNRIIAGDWRTGSGLCHLSIRLLENEEECNATQMGCDPNAICKPTRKGYRCSCKKGWQGNGKNCKDINECLVREGGCVHKCVNIPGSYKCLCYPGFEVDPDDRHNCVDINECAIENGGCEQECINTIGSYECKCVKNGVSYITNQKRCRDANIFCSRFGCEQNCELSHNLRLKACSCFPGYQINMTDGKSCQRTCRVGNGGCHHHCHETESGSVCTCHQKYLLGLDVHTCAASCSVNNGGCEKRCERTNVGVKCSCPNGYVLNNDGKTCNDIDECAVENGGCQHKCVNTIGGFECLCPLGFKLNPLDEKTCIDKDECDVNDTCEHICTNTPGSFICGCKGGYQLFGQTHCGDVDECSFKNGGCSHACINTLGSFYCSMNPPNGITNSRKECVGAYTAMAKLFIVGIPESLKKQYGQGVVEVLRDKVQGCGLRFHKSQGVNNRRIIRQYGRKEGEIFQVHMEIICTVANETSQCNEACKVMNARDALCRSVTELRQFLSEEQVFLIQGKSLLSLPKSLIVRQYFLQSCDSKAEKRREGNLCAKTSVKKDLDGQEVQLTHPYVLNFMKRTFTSAEQCVSGTFWNTSMLSCDVCPKNTYQESNKQTFCKKCPDDSFTDGLGSLSIEDCKRTKCGSFINELSGYVESPNYPAPYPSNTDCTWILKPPKRRRLLVIVPEIKLASTKCEDVLVMRKSKSPYSAVTFEACKDVSRPVAFIAQSRTLWINFKSDRVNNSEGFHISFVTYNEEYQSLIEDIVEDSRLYAFHNHLEILRDKKLLGALMEVIAQPINYYKYESEQRKMFPSSFIRFMTPKVRKFFSY